MENTSFSKPIFKRLTMLSILTLLTQAALFVFISQPDPDLNEQQLNRLNADSRLLGRALLPLLAQNDITAAEQVLFQTLKLMVSIRVIQFVKSYEMAEDIMPEVKYLLTVLSIYLPCGIFP